MRVLLTGSSGWLGRFLAPLPFAHDPDYVSPSTRLANG